MTAKVVFALNEGSVFPDPEHAAQRWERGKGEVLHVLRPGLKIPDIFYPGPGTSSAISGASLCQTAAG